MDVDKAYIRHILEGNTEAYASVVETFGPRVTGLLRALLGDKAEAEDVAQEVFVKAFFGLRSFRGRSRFETWLYRIAYNEALSRLRKKKRWISIDDGHFQKWWGATADRWEDAGEDMPVYAGGVMDAGEIEWIEEENEKAGRVAPEEALAAAVDRLAPLDRLLVRGYYWDDMSVKELSTVTGLREGNVKVRLHRIRILLKKQIQ